MTTAAAGQTEPIITLKQLAIWSLRITSSDMLSICAMLSVRIQVLILTRQEVADVQPAISAQAFCVQIVAANVWAEIASAAAKLILR